MGELNKIIPVNKPVGPTTYDIIRMFKKTTGFNGKIGHGGTLDPFACGVVLLLLGKATQHFEEIKLWEKIYIAGIRLDATSTTGDVAGSITTNKTTIYSKISIKQIEDAIKGFIGEIEQKIPPYSAVKFKGKPLHRLARKGILIERAKRVKISDIELICYNYPLLTLRIKTEGGVYIRQLAQDIAEKLGKTAFLYFLERIGVGDYTLKDCISINDFYTITI